MSFQVSAEILTSQYPKENTPFRKIAAKLIPWKVSFNNPTDMRAVPHKTDEFIVLEKAGKAFWTDGKTKKLMFEVDVKTRSELGLLGLVFHPQFSKNSLFYINYNPTQKTRIEEWQWHENKTPTAKRIILEVDQPFVNHNAGDLKFGPDGYLYIGFGDGGSANDPKGHGQNASSFLGTMIRIDIDKSSKNLPYSIPSDNPFINSKRPEVFSYGLRNPWRYSFDRIGRLIVADVGQNQWEEIHIVPKGSNLGWNIMEGHHCFKKDNCKTPAHYVEPIFEYSRDLGASITGGYEWMDKNTKSLYGKYIFGDFVTGRILAIELPKKSDAQVKSIYDLGNFPISISSFAQDFSGKIYVLDYQGGKIYAIKQQP